MNINYYLLPILGCLNLFSCTQQPSEPTPDKHPNIIYILADDLGYGDVSCLNEASKIPTPHLDKLGANGMIFTDAHSPSSVCTPTRYGILTGRYAWRTSLQNGVSWTFSPPLIDSNRLTVADLLKQQGYHTGCIGKWHLGLEWAKDSTGQIDFSAPINSGPNELGFDYFYGITASLDIPPYYYIENHQITATHSDTIGKMTGKRFWRKSPIGNDFNMIEVLPRLTEKAIDYIQQQQTSTEPFFLYFPLTAPHTPILPNAAFLGKSGTSEYGDFVMMVDDLVGQIVQQLASQDQLDNTIIIFTSDNGCSPMADFEELATFGHDPSYLFRGHKADIFEGGHRIPFMVHWPNKVKAGSQSDETICLTDLMRTLAALVGIQLPTQAGEDSYNILPILLQDTIESPIRPATVHHSINGSFAIRQGDWKLVFCPGSGGWSDPRPQAARAQHLPNIQLFNLKEDIGETTNVAAEHPEQVEKLTKLMKTYIESGRSTPGAFLSNDVEVQLYK